MDIREIQALCKNGKIRWTKHGLERLQERDVSIIHYYSILSRYNNNNCVIVIKNVPCEECEQCGEKYYSDEVAEQLETLVNTAKKLMQEIAVIDYSKVA